MLKFIHQPSVAFSTAVLTALDEMTRDSENDSPKVWVQHTDGGLSFVNEDRQRVCRIEVWGAVSVELTRTSPTSGSSCIGLSTDNVNTTAKLIFDFMKD